MYTCSTISNFLAHDKQNNCYSDRHDIAEILLKVALKSTTKLTPGIFSHITSSSH